MLLVALEEIDHGHTKDYQYVDYKYHMHQWVEQCAIHPDHLHDTPAILWCDCITHFTENV